MIVRQDVWIFELQKYLANLSGERRLSLPQMECIFQAVGHRHLNSDFIIPIMLFYFKISVKNRLKEASQYFEPLHLHQSFKKSPSLGIDL
jgi:hypothetical protein